jgi:hypothetical protein
VCCLHEWLCGTGVIGVVSASFLRGDVYSAAVCWRGVDFVCVLFCIVVIYDIECRTVFRLLFILLVRAINMGFFKAVLVCAFLSDLYCFHCILYVSIRTTNSQCVNSSHCWEV